MMKLTHLFDERRGILDNGSYVRSRAPEVFEKTPLRLAHELATGSGKNRVVLGVAFYSRPDLELLDALVQKLRSGNCGTDRPIYVFDALMCKSMEDFERLVPGIAPVYDTPVVGIWEGGELVSKGWGIWRVKSSFDIMECTPDYVERAAL